jgi:hypothetical protein
MINTDEQPGPGFIGMLQKLIVKFSLWFTLPLTLLIFAIWFIKKHEPFLSYIVTFLYPVIGTAIVLFFWCTYEGVKLKRLKRDWGKIILAFLVLIWQAFILLFIIPVSRQGIPFDESGFKWKVARCFKSLMYVDLKYEILFTDRSSKNNTTYWRDFENSHLEGATLTYSVLKRANFREASLKRANLSGADLERANLEDANLEGASLDRANLSRASLQGANLERASLVETSLKEAYLSLTNLRRASIQRATLEGADLVGAILENADLRGANLRNANLSGTILFNANLRETDLRGILERVKVNVIIPDTQEQSNEALIAQFSRVETLYEAKLDPPLLERIQRDYPHLLEEPK